MIQTFKPASALLQPYVDFFYVFSLDASETISYIAFPHVNSSVAFFKGVEIERVDHELFIRATDPSACTVEILGKYTQPVFVNYAGTCEEIAIVFKPLGLNHFFEEEVGELTPLFSQALQQPDWQTFSKELFEATNLTQKLELLEAFLVRKIQVRDFGKMHQAIHYLEDVSANYSIEQVAEQCGMTTKTFQRTFSKHFACSPSEYKRIARFRHSIQHKLLASELKSLTSLSYDTHYYDQSYFIREYKKLTQLNPKRFFDSITVLHEKKIVWKVR